MRDAFLFLWEPVLLEIILSAKHQLLHTEVNIINLIAHKRKNTTNCSNLVFIVVNQYKNIPFTREKCDQVRGATGITECFLQLVKT